MGVSKNNATPKSSHFNGVFHYKPSILEKKHILGNIHMLAYLYILSMKAPPCLKD